MIFVFALDGASLACPQDPHGSSYGIQLETLPFEDGELNGSSNRKTCSRLMTVFRIRVICKRYSVASPRSMSSLLMLLSFNLEGESHVPM